MMAAKPNAWLIYFLAALLVFAGLGVIFASEADYRRQVDEDTRAKAEILAASVVAAVDFDDPQAAQEAVDAYRVNRQLRSAQVLDSEGATLASYQREVQGTADGGAISIAQVPVTIAGKTIGRVIVKADRNPLTQRLARYLIIALLLTFAGLVVFVLGRAQANARRANRALQSQAEELSLANAALTEEIAHRETIEAARREADALYRAYFENTNEHLFVLEVTPDERFVFLSTNPTCGEETGLTTELAAGKTAERLFDPATAAMLTANYRRCVETGLAQHYAETLDLPAGRKSYETVLVPIRTTGGRIDRIMGSGREVTGRLRLEEALRQSQKMEAIGQLTGGIAHDFNNILGAIVGVLELVDRKAGDPDRVRKLARGGLEAAEKGARLTSQLLTFSRKQRLQLQPLNISETVHRMRDLLTTTVGANIALELDLRDGDVRVVSDLTQLEMAILNLSINARDAMPAGGVLTMATAVRDVRDDPDLTPGCYVEFSVADTGCGMTEDVLARAMDPFFTTKELGKGTGLGLSQVFGLAKLSEGALRISSEPGTGSRISIFLKQSAAELAGEVREPIAADEASSRTASVLLVDDDEGGRPIIAEALESAGFEVVQARDGAQALDRLAGALPDVLVVDYAMPEMNGAQLARAARDLDPRLPIVFISGFSDSGAIEAAAGALTVVLRKPFRIAELTASIRNCLVEREAPAPGERPTA